MHHFLQWLGSNWCDKLVLSSLFYKIKWMVTMAWWLTLLECHYIKSINKYRQNYEFAANCKACALVDPKHSNQLKDIILAMHLQQPELWHAYYYTQAIPVYQWLAISQCTCTHHLWQKFLFNFPWIQTIFMVIIFYCIDWYMKKDVMIFIFSYLVIPHHFWCKGLYKYVCIHSWVKALAWLNHPNNMYICTPNLRYIGMKVFNTGQK